MQDLNFEYRRCGSLELLESNKPLGIFKHNREIKKTILNPIIKSMEKEGYRKTEPVIIGIYNNEAIIIDGQHRYEAQQCLMRSGREDIYYTFVVEDLTGMTDSDIGKRIIEYNTQKKTWNVMDYLHLYKGLNYPNYVKLAELVEEYGYLSMQLRLFRLADKNNTPAIFRQGLFNFVENKVSYIRNILCIYDRVLKEHNNKGVFISHYIIAPLYRFLEQQNNNINIEKFMNNIFAFNEIEDEQSLMEEFKKRLLA
jgi:hypothetical protein